MMDGGKDKKDDPLSYDAPEANAYEFQSGGIIALLKRLRDEFRSKLSTCQKEEMNSAQAHVAEDTKTLTSTMAEKEENTKTLADMTAECHEKGLSYEENTKTLADMTA